MTDRVPGAPGQYTMTVSASEAQKLLTGEAVTVTLVRNDQPLVDGTPYNKASVLPDDLALILCPSASDPTPADALRGCLPKTGGAMTGTMNMNNQALTGLRAPAGDTDAVNLKTLKDYGPALLWTNSNPTAEYGKQDLTISGLSGYPVRLVDFVFYNASGYSDMVSTMVITNNNNRFLIYASGVAGTAWRTVTPSGDKLSFSECNMNFDGDTNNAFLIPLRVYGIR